MGSALLERQSIRIMLAQCPQGSWKESRIPKMQILRLRLAVNRPNFAQDDSTY